MKKTLLTILAFIYLFNSSRVTVYLHDCMEIFADSQTTTHSKKDKTFPCKNDPLQCKLQTEHRMSEAAIKSLRVFSNVLIPPVVTYEFEKPAAEKPDNFQDYPFVKYNKVSLFILLCIFRI